MTFTEDSAASLKARNYYINRDYKGSSPQSASREWAQGFIASFASGYTPGPLGLGLEGQAWLDLKLDSSSSRVGTGLLPNNPYTHEPSDEYSELGLTTKARIDKTELRWGTLAPARPVIYASQTWLFSQTFRGAELKSQQFDNMLLFLGQVDRNNLRDSTDYQPLSVASPNGRFNPAATSSRFRYVGGDFRLGGPLVVRLTTLSYETCTGKVTWASSRV
ncbi:outer membrane porin, OprD family [Pseudomonas sp. S75]|uniref:OprD family outer membrane porin n=1 Tax=unclassified Pseudomonas TaxID=196821 RepID=UPI001908E390|nr:MULTISPECIES: OprD family outer membrane porin [unclassified Pseudomonas]MBJ9974169.1 outer membrane porin, OprD family [Pseudomonas sp. S30]MBK0151901.1 outer membrane porin, OprD family [Pseudomonas sp. S75]